ncbi:MAG: hypothetical protein KF893_22995 [Caldilineaceae bacterium]|nr:hypothetical protein [Caldilineaceae bacterium]
MYWLYRTHIFSMRNRPVMAKLVSPVPTSTTDNDCGFGFTSPRQDVPYGVALEFTYQVSSKHNHPDNYAEDSGFTLYSQRLIDIMSAFEVKFESFPVIMVDEKGNELLDLKYWVFHSLEGVLEAMDEEKSGWTGNHREGIPQLVLDYSKFEHRPIFKCNHVYVQLMRDDLKQEIRRLGIAGIDFLAPERFRSGRYGPRPDYDD